MSKIIKYNMQLEVLTAVHIGGTSYKSTLGKMDYLFNNEERKLIIIDNAKFMRLLSDKKLLDKYISYIESTVNDKVQTHKRTIKLSNFLLDNKLESSIKDFIKKEYSKLDFDIKNLNDIKLMNRDVNLKPIIQGSSIKGALINLLLVDYISRNNQEFSREKKEILDKVRLKDIKGIKIKIEEIAKKILYNNDSLLKDTKKIGISISDTYKYENTRTNFYQDIDENLESKKESRMPIIREYIMKNSKFYFDLTLDLDLLSKTKLKINSYNDLENSLGRAVDYIIKNTLETKINNPNHNLILGANTGFHQKTIVHALFQEKKDRLNVVKLLLHKDKIKIANHLNDKNFSPRVLNFVKINGTNELAGLVSLTKIGEKNVSTT